MKRVLLAAGLAAAAIVPGAAPGAACSPLSCAPNEVPLAGGKLLAVRTGGIGSNVRVLDLQSGKTKWWLPPGVFGGDLLIHQDGTLLTWFDAGTGARVASAVAHLRGTFSLVGGSLDGRRAVLARTERRRTTFAIFSPAGQRQVVLGGNTWSFDALAGDRLYLIRALRDGYQVRLYDLIRNTLDPEPLQDPGESALIQGVAWQRLVSSDRRYLFTLYLTGEGSATVHELDVRAGTARCIDLPGGGDFSGASTYALALSKNGRTLWAISSGYGRVAAIDVVTRRIRTQFAFTGGARTGSAGIAAMAPDGRRIAITDARRIWFVEPDRKRVVLGQNHVAVAMAFSTDGRKLWVIGERSRVSSVPARS